MKWNGDNSSKGYNNLKGETISNRLAMMYTHVNRDVARVIEVIFFFYTFLQKFIYLIFREIKVKAYSILTLYFTQLNDILKETSKKIDVTSKDIQT